MSDGFTTHVDGLHNVSKTDLPFIIDAVNGARSQLSAASQEQPDAFAGYLYHKNYAYNADFYDRAYPNSSGDFGVGDYVRALIDDLVQGLGDLSAHLGQTQAAILEVANRYREADGLPRYPN